MLSENAVAESRTVSPDASRIESGVTIGALAGSITELHVLGRFFTRRDNRLLNTLVALAVPLGVGLLLAAAVGSARQ